MEAEQIAEITQLMTGVPETPPEPAEGRTEPEVPEHEDVPLAAEASEPEQDAVEVEEPETVPEPTNIKGLAEKLGTSPGKLYRDVELVPGLTLGQAKDRAKELLEADGMLASVEERRIATTNEIEQARHDARLALSLPDMTPEQRQAAYGTYTEQQNRIAMDTIEGWKEPGTREAELTEISSLLQEYGVPQARADNTVDAVELRILADYNRLRKRIQAATKPVQRSQKQNKANSHKSAKSTANRTVDQYSKGEISQNAAVVALMNS